MLCPHIKNLYENKKGLQYSKPFLYDKQRRLLYLFVNLRLLFAFNYFTTNSANEQYP